MNRLEELCAIALELTEEDFEEMDEIIRQQLEYCQPLKMATTAWQHELGRHNQAVVAKIRELKDVILQGANIQRPGGGGA